jgi:hypothetical protein
MCPLTQSKLSCLDKLLKFILLKFPILKYVSIFQNMFQVLLCIKIYAIVQILSYYYVFYQIIILVFDLYNVVLVCMYFYFWLFYDSR